MLKHLHLTRRQWLGVLRWTLYSLLLLFVLLLQTVVLARNPVFGAKLAPVSVVIICVCIREGPEKGGLFALLASLFWYMSGAYYGNLAVAILPVGSILAAVLCRSAFRQRLLSTLLFCFAICLLNDLTVFIFKLLLLEKLALRNLWQVLLPGTCLTMLFVPLIYFPVKLIHRIGGKHDL